MIKRMNSNFSLARSILLLFFSLSIISCASKPIATILNDAQSACDKGNGYGCYIVGEGILHEEKNYAKAIPFLKKGCDENWAYACSDLSIAKSESSADQSSGFPDALKSCELGDGIGCYNAACYSCPKKPDQALDYIKKSFLLGYNNPEHMLNDSDLACISERQELKRLSEMMLARKDAVVIDDFHVFAKSLGGAILVPQGFEILNGDPLVAYDTSGARIFYSSSNFSVNQSIELEKLNTTQSKILAEKVSTKNGLPYYFKKSTTVASDQNFISMVGITGTENFTLQVTSFYPKFLESQFEGIFSAVASSLMLKPWNLPDASSNLLSLSTLKNGLSYAGKVSSSLHFNQSGKMDPTLRNTLVVQPIVVASTEKFNLTFAKQQIDSIIQSLLKNQLTEKITSITNPWPGFSTSATGDRLQNLKEKINLKINLFDTGKKLDGYSIFALALIISSAENPDQKFLKTAESAVLKIKINQKAFNEALKSKIQLPKEKTEVGTGGSKVGLRSLRNAL